MIRLMLIGALLYALAPLLPPFATVSRLDLAARLAAAAVLVWAAWAQGARPAGRLATLRFLAPVVALAVAAWLILDSRKPASIAWAFVLIQMWTQAHAFAPRAWLYTLALATPLGVLAGFGAAGFDHAELGAPAFMVAACPIVYCVVANAASRRTEAEALRTEVSAGALAQRLAEAQRRLKTAVLEPLAQHLEDAGAARARALSVDLAAGDRDPGALHVLVVEVRRALHKLRAAVWALDQEASAWAVLEPYVIKMAADLASPGECAVISGPAAALSFGSGARLALVTALEDHVRPTPGSHELVFIRQGDELFLEVRDVPAAHVDPAGKCLIGVVRPLECGEVVIGPGAGSEQAVVS